MIGLGIALAQPRRTVAVFDGDGACIMHTGALAVLANRAPDNLVHILFNNEAHESVGGMPTASGSVDWPAVARRWATRTRVRRKAKRSLSKPLDYR